MFNTENQPKSQIFKKKKVILVEFALPCLALITGFLLVCCVFFYCNDFVFKIFHRNNEPNICSKAAQIGILCHTGTVAGNEKMSINTESVKTIKGIQIDSRMFCFEPDVS